MPVTRYQLLLLSAEGTSDTCSDGSREYPASSDKTVCEPGQSSVGAELVLLAEVDDWQE